MLPLLPASKYEKIKCYPFRCGCSSREHLRRRYTTRKRKGKLGARTTCYDTNTQISSDSAEKEKEKEKENNLELPYYYNLHALSKYFVFCTYFVIVLSISSHFVLRILYFVIVLGISYCVLLHFVLRIVRTL
jgi:hypothetical protein